MSTEEDRDLDSAMRKRLLLDCLPLLATYAWGGRTPLTPTPLGTDGETTIDDFLREFRMRHALACGARLFDVLDRIGAQTSTSSRLVRSESRGTIRGRLDVQRYVARAASRRSHPRLYPIVRNDLSAQTPENELVTLGLREIISALLDNPFPPKSNESVLAAKILAGVRRRLSRRPWAEVVTTRAAARLRPEVQTRVRRRQTANDPAYQELLDWYAEWSLDLRNLGELGKNNFLDGILALPSGDSFWNRAFEIWCLEFTMAALRDLGWIEVVAPRALHRVDGKVSQFRTPSGKLVDVRFQTHDPLPTGRWRYRDGRALGGIPDISLTVDSAFPILLIDAKFRWNTARTTLARSEETYKMLGYAENYAHAGTHFRGVLIFPTNESQHRVVEGPKGGRIDLVTVALTSDREIAQAV